MRTSGSHTTAIRTVLVVDDMSDVRLALRLLLETAGFHVLDADTAPMAMRWLSLVHVDVVVTDIFMPGEVDGVGLIAQLRARSKRPAIIAMSGAPHRAYRESLDEAQQLGADLALEKPVPGDELVKVIHELIDRIDTLDEETASSL